MVNITIRHAKEIEKDLKTFWPKLRRELTNIVREQSKLLTAYVITRHLTGGTTKDRLKVRTGHLRRTTKPRKIEVKKYTVIGGVNFGAIYAKVHIGRRGKETIIKPRRAKMLAIPLPAALTGAGVIKGRPRDFDRTFIKEVHGNPIIFQNQNGKAVPLFVLKHSVKIPARVHPEDITEVFAPKIEKQVSMTVERIWQKR